MKLGSIKKEMPLHETESTDSSSIQVEENQAHEIFVIEEVLATVLSFLPTYSELGQNSLKTVAKKWNELLSNGKYFKKQKSFDKLLDSCREDPNGVIYILSVPSIIKNLK
ncbi:MAG: hypothetical protein AB7V32_02520, partial [Candidatus Berkiella sp.]